MSDEVFYELLSTKGLRVTDTRIRVLQTLGGARSALSHQEISDSVGSIDKVTLYRILHIFEQKKIIHRVATVDRQTRFALCLRGKKADSISIDHAHFECNLCHRIFCLPRTKVSINTNMSDKNGFQITYREIRLHGVCPDCAKTGKTATS